MEIAMPVTQIPQMPQPAGSGWLPDSLQSPRGDSELLHALFEGNPDLVVVVDAEQRIVAANSSAMAAFGYLRGELEGQPLSLLLPEAARERHAGRVRSLQDRPSARSTGSDMELKARDARGNEFAVDVMLWPLGAEGGRYVVAVCRRLDAALSHSQVQIHAMVESVRDYAFNLLDAQGRILTWNEGARRIHGLSSVEALGRNFAIFFLPADIAQGEPERLLAEATRDGHSHSAGWQAGAHGESIWAKVDLTAMRDASGQLTGFTRVLHDMTEHKQAEDAQREGNRALLESEERFRLLVEHVADYAIYMLDPEGRVVTWNIGAERAKGFKAEEVMGRSFSIFFPPEDAATGAPDKELAAARCDGRFETETWRQRKDGTKFWALETLTAIHGRDGELRGFAAVTRDMTKQKEAKDALLEGNRALLESEERFRLLVDQVSDYAIYMLDLEGRVVTWNIGAERTKGFKAEEVMGLTYSIFFTPEDAAAGLPAKELAAAAREGRYETEAWRQRKDGTKFWALVSLTAIRGRDGELRGYAKVIRDMTKQKVAAEGLLSLNAQLERYRIFVENVDEYAIYTIDAQGLITSWGTGAQKVSGVAAEQVLGRHYSLFFPPAAVLAGVPDRQLAEAARLGRYMTDAWMVTPDGGRKWSSGVVNAVRDDDGELTGFIRVARDMTKQKLLEESLAQLHVDLEDRVAERTRQLEETNIELHRKNREVEAFVYIVSHDLRGPLVNVQGFARELEQSCASLKTILADCELPTKTATAIGEILEEDIPGALKFISASSSKFERLIDSLLGLSRYGRQVYQIVEVDAQELVEDAVASMRHHIVEAGADIEIGRLPSVRADATALGQVFSNLIGNAMKYREPRRPLRIEVGGKVEGEMVHYWVRDNGLGIPETGKSRLFQVFQRLHPQQAAGEGMGLAIAHRIVERHGGKIWAESSDGEGTVFHFSLPSVQPPAPGSAQNRISDDAA
jgi:PAS domain S-box-containing protein